MAPWLWAHSLQGSFGHTKPAEMAARGHSDEMEGGLNTTALLVAAMFDCSAVERDSDKREEAEVEEAG